MTVVHHNGNAPFSSVRKTDVLTFKLMVQNARLSGLSNKQNNYEIILSDKRDSNPQPFDWKSNALPIELLSQLKVF